MKIAALIVLLAAAVATPAAANNNDNGVATTNGDTEPSNSGGVTQQSSSLLAPEERDLGFMRDLGSSSGDHWCFCERRRNNGRFDDDEDDDFDDDDEECEDIPRRRRCVARSDCRWVNGKCRDDRRELEELDRVEEAAPADEEEVEVVEEWLDEEDRELVSRNRGRWVNQGGVGGYGDGWSTYSRSSDDYHPSNSFCRRINWESRCERAGCRWIERFEECVARRSDYDRECRDYDYKKYCLRGDGCAWTCISRYTNEAMVGNSYVVKQPMANPGSDHVGTGSKISLGLASAAAIYVLWFF